MRDLDGIVKMVRDSSWFPDKSRWKESGSGWIVIRESKVKKEGNFWQMLKNKIKFHILAWFTVAVIILIPVLILFNWSWNRFREGVASAQQEVVYYSLYHHISAGNEVPQTLSEVVNFEDWKKPFQINYYPDAWARADRILLQTPIRTLSGCSYVVTFGNKSCAVLTSWDGGVDNNDISLKRIYCRRFNLSFLRVYGFIAIILVVLIFRFLKPSGMGEAN